MTDGIFVLSGCNIGDRIQQLSHASDLLQDMGFKVKKHSMIYESAAWGPIKQQDFLNQVLQVSTNLGPHELLEKLLETERAMGRLRTQKWGPRIIDLDLLYYNQEIIRSKDLTLPHPFIPERRFTLMPLDEIAPDFVHPVLKKDQRTLLEECPDSSRVKPLV